MRRVTFRRVCHVVSLWTSAAFRHTYRRCRNTGSSSRTFSKCTPRRPRMIVVARLLAVGVVTSTLIQLALLTRTGKAQARVTLNAPSADWIRSAFSQLELDELAKRAREVDHVTAAGGKTNIHFRRRFSIIDANSSMNDVSLFTWRDIDGSRITCFRSGVHQQHAVTRAQLYGYGRCRCRRGWHGRGCGVPEVVWRFRRRLPFSIDQLTLRRRPRRVVQAMPFSTEFDLLDVRLAEIGDVVDVFLVVESNYTSHGDRKPFRLRDRLRASGCDRRRHDSDESTGNDVTDRLILGKYNSSSSESNWTSASPHCNKIFVVELDFFPERALENGMVVERLLRDYLGVVGLRMVDGLRRSDLFILTDADELPTREVVDFLRWHDGYTQPVTLSYSHTIFNFRWGRRNSDGTYTMTRLPAVVTVGFLQEVFEGHAFDIRAGLQAFVGHTVTLLANYVINNTLPNFRPWTLGSTGESVIHEFRVGDDGRLNPVVVSDAVPSPSALTAAGWHCSWCLPVDGIRTKMTSAQNGDFPRWGDFPAKLDPVYIGRLIECGMWFDDKSSLDIIAVPFVPRSIGEVRERFGYLLPSIDERSKNDSCAPMSITTTDSTNI